MTKSELEAKLRKKHLMFEEETLESCLFDKDERTWEVYVMEKWDYMILTLDENLNLMEEK